MCGAATRNDARRGEERLASFTGRLILLIIITGDNKRFEGGSDVHRFERERGLLSIADRDDERMVRVARENNGSSAVARL